MRLNALRVVSLDASNRVFLWQAEDSSLDSYFDYTLQVERSESSEGPFHPVSPWFRGHYRFVDTNIPEGNRWRQLHYRLRLRNLKTGEEFFSGTATQEPIPDLKAVEIRRHLHLLFKEHAGRRVWLFPSRTFGERCTCWDPTLGQSTRSRCLSCYDTTFLGGYLRPIEMFVDIDPSGNTNQPTMQAGNLQPNSTTARTGHYPSLKPDDLLVEGENLRWVVVSVTNTEHLRAPLMQHLQLRQVFPDDIEMLLPINLEDALEDIWLSPSRAYTEPQDIDTGVNWMLREAFKIGDRQLCCPPYQRVCWPLPCLLWRRRPRYPVLLNQSNGSRLFGITA